MKKLFKSVFLASIIAIFACANFQTVLAGEKSIEDIAKEYMATYPIANVDKTLSYYTDKTVWKDPRFAPGVEFVGRPAIEEMMRAFASDKNIKAFSYKPTLDYIVGDYAIFKYTMGITFEHEGKILKAEDVDGIAVMRIVDGKVVEHTDFTNVKMFNEKLGVVEN